MNLEDRNMLWRVAHLLEEILREIRRAIKKDSKRRYQRETKEGGEGP